MTTTGFVVRIVVLNTVPTLMTKPCISSMPPATVLGKLQTYKPNPELSMQIQPCMLGPVIVIMLSAYIWHQATQSNLYMCCTQNHQSGSLSQNQLHILPRLLFAIFFQIHYCIFHPFCVHFVFLCSYYIPWAARCNTWLLVQLTWKGVVFSSLFLSFSSYYIACDVSCDAGGGAHQRRQLGPVDVHDPGSGVQGNHNRAVLHQRLHLHQQLCAQCQEGECPL